MIKLIGLSLLALLVSGCATQKVVSTPPVPASTPVAAASTPATPTAPTTASVLFQTVSEKDAILVQEGKNKRYCVRCGMDLVRFYKTSHMAEQDGKPVQYCSLHCLEEHLREGVTLKNPKVVDVSTLKFISIADAFYIVGSSKRGTMSRVSKYAFSNLEDAKKFQKLYGGEIMDFKGAHEKAKEDFVK